MTRPRTAPLEASVVAQPQNVVLHYLDCLVAHDWTAVAECLHPEVVRVGPFGDTYTPREIYVEFLSDLLPILLNYSMAIERVWVDGPVVIVQLTESMEIRGSMDATREVLVFTIDDAGLISRIEIFIQRVEA